MEARKTVSDHLTQENIKKAFEKIKSDPEFAVPGCHYETASEDRRRAVLDFIRDQFMPDEPLARSIGCPWTEEVETLWASVINWNISLLLISDTTDQVVAVRISRISKKDDQFDISALSSEDLRKIFGITVAFNIICNVYDHYKVDDYINFLALGVHADYRRKGIGLKIQKAAVAMAKNFEVGPVLLRVEATSNFSKKIFEKLGFDTLGEILYEDHKENGEVVFKNMGDNKSVKLYGKIIG